MIRTSSYSKIMTMVMSNCSISMNDNDFSFHDQVSSINSMQYNIVILYNKSHE